MFILAIVYMQYGCLNIFSGILLGKQQTELSNTVMAGNTRLVDTHRFC